MIVAFHPEYRFLRQGLTPENLGLEFSQLSAKSTHWGGLSPELPRICHCPQGSVPFEQVSGLAIVESVVLYLATVQSWHEGWRTMAASSQVVFEEDNVSYCNLGLIGNEDARVEWNLVEEGYASSPNWEKGTWESGLSQLTVRIIQHFLPVGSPSNPELRL